MTGRVALPEEWRNDGQRGSQRNNLRKQPDAFRIYGRIESLFRARRNCHSELVVIAIGRGRLPGRGSLVLVNHAFFHHKKDMFGLPNILQRIPRHRNDVRELSILQRTDFIG